MSIHCSMLLRNCRYEVWCWSFIRFFKLESFKCSEFDYFNTNSSFILVNLEEIWLRSSARSILAFYAFIILFTTFSGAVSNFSSSMPPLSKVKGSFFQNKMPDKAESSSFNTSVPAASFLPIKYSREMTWSMLVKNCTRSSERPE